MVVHIVTHVFISTDSFITEIIDKKGCSGGIMRYNRFIPPISPNRKPYFQVSYMKIAKILGIIVLIDIVLFALIQLVPYGRNHKNPPVVQEPNWDAQTRAIAKKACFDCHSNETL